MDVPRTNDAHWEVNISQKTERERERERGRGRRRGRGRGRGRGRERERAKSCKEDDQILFLYIFLTSFLTRRPT